MERYPHLMTILTAKSCLYCVVERRAYTLLLIYLIKFYDNENLKSNAFLLRSPICKVV